MSEAVVKIPPELFALAESSRFEGTLDLPSLAVGPDDYAFARPVEWEVDITNTGSALLVSGRARGSATVACSRCLEEVAYGLDGDIEGYFLVEGAEAGDAGGAEDEPGADEFDVLPADHVIDLEPLIRSALVMDVPGMPLCDEGCAGLCPTCGANLNEGACGCDRDGQRAEPEQRANPFAVLANYRFDE